jgi:hypothetical protein
MTPETSLTPAAQQVVDLSRPGPVNEIDPLAIIEQRNKLLDRILEVAIKSTHAGQWTNLGGKPWPTGPAAESMARRCAVSITNISREKLQSQDDKGPFYIWVYRATFSLPGGRDVIEAEGTCSSRDSFLGTETSAGRPLSEIDEGSVMKAAFTNCRVNGITQLLGLRNMTWDRLAALGIDPDGVAKVDYDHGAKGGGRGKSGDDVELKFGRGKGKNLSEVSDDDVRWYVGCWEKDLADPAKEKFHKFSKKNIEIATALLAARANEKAGTTAAPGAPAASPWDRIRALDPTIPFAELKDLVKATTKKANSRELVDADVQAMAAVIEKRKADANTDIPF